MNPIYDSEDIVIDDDLVAEPEAKLVTGFWYVGRVVGTFDSMTVIPELVGAKTSQLPAPGETGLANQITLTADGYFRFFAVVPTLRLRTSTDSDFANTTIGASTDVVATITRETVPSK